MIPIRKFWGNSLILAFPLFILSSCSTSPEKITPEKYVPKTLRVEISQMKFQPATITVHQGDTVEWINKDMVVHDVTQVPNSTWTSSSLAPGKSWKMVVAESDDYYCSIHVVMVGKLIVQKP
ncbi:MAG: cupredoxin domain-containing protein [Bacteroidota bacterium]|nr:cupredoxin domain-containing protein [Bacteroidota bacterium]MDP4212962.1 cupredoxin domain-containing protein [Bacteroidota bacterium]MDP4250784.1 cupredoxin domain-containing protein [Bacteroidota bacterium]